MDKTKKDTLFMANKLDNATSLSEGLTIINSNNDSVNNKNFREYFDEYLANHQNLKTSVIINNSGLSKSYAHEVINGIKKASRDKIIAICFAARMNKQEMNYALKFSGNNELYERSTRDQYIILAINMVQLGNQNFNTVTELNTFLSENSQEELQV